MGLPEHQAELFVLLHCIESRVERPVSQLESLRGCIRTAYGYRIDGIWIRVGEDQGGDPAIGEAGDVDTAVITLKMENGAIAVIDNCRKAVYGYDQRAEVFGSEGMAAISNDSQSTTVISNAQGVTGEKPMFFFLERYMDAYGKEITAFIDAIEKGKDTPLNVYDGLKPVLMGLAAKKSSQEHRPVKISEIMGE